MNAYWQEISSGWQPLFAKPNWFRRCAMLTKSKIVLGPASLVLCATFLPAQDDAACLRRTVVVSVVAGDKSGVVTGLTTENFRGQFQGKPVRMLSAERESRPNRVVILLDASGSMGVVSPPKLAFAQHLALTLTWYTPPDSSIAFMTFSDKVANQVGFGHTRNDIAQTIPLLGTKDYPAGKGRTALYDGIMEALRSLGPTGPQDVIYLLTDGGPSSSRTSNEKVKQALRDSGVRLYAVVLSDPNPPTLEELAALDLLAELAELTGGTIVFDWNVDLSKEEKVRSQAMVRGLINRVAESYRLEFELSQAPKKKQSWKLEVVGLPKIKGGTRVSYPRHLLPCSDVTPKN